MQMSSCFIRLVVYNIMVKIEFKIDIIWIRLIILKFLYLVVMMWHIKRTYLVGFSYIVIKDERAQALLYAICPPPPKDPLTLIRGMSATAHEPWACEAALVGHRDERQGSLFAGQGWGLVLSSSGSQLLPPSDIACPLMSWGPGVWARRAVASRHGMSQGLDNETSYEDESHEWLPVAMIRFRVRLDWMWAGLTMLCNS
jgi:hypothetical protein